MLQIDGAIIETDNDGYLLHFAEWNTDVATAIADSEGIALSAAHWEVIHLLRDFYQRYEQSPAMRPLVKFVGQQLGADKARVVIDVDRAGDAIAQAARLPDLAYCINIAAARGDFLDPWRVNQRGVDAVFDQHDEHRCYTGAGIRSA